jgi:hypothetical protein
VYATVLDQAGTPAQLPPVGVEVGDVVVDVVVVVEGGGGLPDTGQVNDLTVVIHDDPASGYYERCKR